jgi:hypothetical protein
MSGMMPLKKAFIHHLKNISGRDVASFSVMRLTAY